MTANQIEQFVQRPDCAESLLGAEPRCRSRLIDYRPGFEAESNSLFLQFPELRDVDKKEMSAEDWRNLAGEDFHAAERIHRRPEVESALLRAVEEAALALQGYPAGEAVSHRARAAGRGSGGDARGESPHPLQRGRITGSFATKVFKTMFLAYADGKEVAVARRRVRENGHLPNTGKSSPLPRCSCRRSSQTKVAETRVVWICARLRILEALRIYAAAHDGKLPDGRRTLRKCRFPAIRLTTSHLTIIATATARCWTARTARRVCLGAMKSPC